MAAAEDAAAAAADPGTDVSRSGRRVRLVLSVAVLATLGYGTVHGRDDMFPFGPFTMYAGWYPPNGVISSNLLKAQLPDGRIVSPGQSDVGVARADIEGELGAFRADPSRLGALAAVHHRRAPGAPPYVRVWIEQTRWQLRDRAVVATTHVTLVEWQAP